MRKGQANIEQIYSVKHFGSAKLAQKDFPKEYLPQLSKLDAIDQMPQFKQVGWSHTNPIQAPLDGYRYVYADEVHPGCTTFSIMQEQISDWAILWLINGWTEGHEYNHPNGSTICDNGERINDIG